MSASYFCALSLLGFLRSFNCPTFSQVLLLEETHVNLKGLVYNQEVMLVGLVAEHTLSFNTTGKKIVLELHFCFNVTVTYRHGKFS